MLDSLSYGFEGSLIGSIYASIDLILIKKTFSFGITIPIFNIAHTVQWPPVKTSASGSIAASEQPWPTTIANVSDGTLTLSPPSGHDTFKLTQTAPGSVSVLWVDPNQSTDNYVPSETFSGISSIDFAGGPTGYDTLIAGSGFDIPITAACRGGTT